MTAAPPARKRRATKAKPAASSQQIVQALKDIHFKREVRQQMQREADRLNARMRNERYDDITRGLTAAARQNFAAHARGL